MALFWREEHVTNRPGDDGIAQIRWDSPYIPWHAPNTPPCCRTVWADIYLFIYLFIFIYLSMYVFIYWCMYVFIYSFIYLFIYLYTNADNLYVYIIWDRLVLPICPQFQPVCRTADSSDITGSFYRNMDVWWSTTERIPCLQLDIYMGHDAILRTLVSDRLGIFHLSNWFFLDMWQTGLHHMVLTCYQVTGFHPKLGMQMSGCYNPPAPWPKPALVP